MRRNSLTLSAALIGLGLLTGAQVQAQSTVVGKGEQKTVIGSTAGPVNATLDRSPAQTDQSGTGLLHLKDLLNYKIVAQDGGFGQVHDIVFDRNGQLQYLLGSYDGKVFPLPFVASAMNPSGSTLTYNVPMATLQQMALNPHQLPTLHNQAFVQRMQQVFGPSFGANTSQALSAYPPTPSGVNPIVGRDTGVGRTSTAVPTPTGRMETGATRPTGGSLNSSTGIEPRVGQGTGGTTTSASGALSGAAIGGAPGSTGGTSGTAGGAPAQSPGTGTSVPSKSTGSAGTSGSGSGTTGSSGSSGSGS